MQIGSYNSDLAPIRPLIEYRAWLNLVFMYYVGLCHMLLLHAGRQLAPCYLLGMKVNLCVFFICYCRSYYPARHRIQ